MKNQSLLLYAGVAVLGYILYKKYTTQVTNAAQFVPSAPVTNAPAQIQQPVYTPAAPITAVLPTNSMPLTFDTIQNF